MSTSEILVVDPTAEDSVQRAALAPRLKTLRGMRIGIIDNAKHMADSMLAETQVLLRTHYGVKNFAYYRKSNASVPTPPEVLADLVAECDALVHGVAD